MKNNYLLITVLLFSVSIYSQNFDKSLDSLKTENKNCLDKGEFMHNCSLEFYKKSDSLLNVVYKHVRKKQSLIENETLKIDQLKWVKQRNQQFEKINNQNTGLGNGLDDLLAKNQKKSDIVNKRTLFLISNYISKKTSKNATEIRKFIPENYSIFDTIKGNLNNDNFDDYILILKKNNEENTSNYNNNKPEKRPLLILTGNKNGELKLEAENKNTVLCIDCSGAIHGDSYEKVTIKNGYFSVEYYTLGGNEKWARIVTFKYDKTVNNWFLSRDGIEFYSFNPDTSDNTEAIIKTGEKILTKKDFGKIQFKDYNIYSE